jgi:limonene-1,2-epoxide hydrolase
MSIEYQKIIVKRFFLDVLMEGELEILEKILDNECSYFDGGMLKYTNREDFIKYVREARKPYTSIEVVIDEIISEDNSVAVRCTYNLGTKEDRSTFSVMGFFKFYEDRIVKIWRNIVLCSKQEK